MVVVPGLSPTRPSVSWSITRSDSPSETTAPSSEVGSEVVPKTRVSLVAALPLPAASVAAAVANAATVTASSTFRPLCIVLLLPKLSPPLGGRGRRTV